MKIKLFKEFNSQIFSNCIKCGEEFYGDFDICDDCKDFDLEAEENEDEESKKNINKELKMPFFGVPTTRSQNIYYL